MRAASSTRRAISGEIDAAPIEIGEGAWIGFGSFVLKGVSIGAGAVVGAGSVVTADVPPNAIVVGNPARSLGSSPRREVAGRRLTGCYEPSSLQSWRSRMTPDEGLGYDRVG